MKLVSCSTAEALKTIAAVADGSNDVRRRLWVHGVKVSTATGVPGLMYYFVTHFLEVQIESLQCSDSVGWVTGRATYGL